MAFFLAVDAGGTKTDYVLADEKEIVARVRSGTIKRLRTDKDTAASHLNAGLAALVRRSGVSMSAVQRTCIGTAGESVPLVADWLREAFSTRVAGRVLLLGDVEIALDAAFRGGPGVLALAGTGSNVAGRTPGGIRSTCGGWGPMLSDQGSGHAIGARALRSLFLAIDEGRETLLKDAVLQFWDLTSLEQLIEHANRTPAPDVSTLTHLVLQCTDQDDLIAKQVLEREGEELAYLVRLLIRRMQSVEGNHSFAPTLAFAGSIMERVPPVRHALIAAVQREFPKVFALPGVVDPIEGALWRARDEAAFEARC